MFGLLFRGKKGSPYKYQINTLDYQFIIYVTIFAAYFCSVTTIITSLTSPEIDIALVLNGVMLTIQITFQTFLMKSQGRNLSNTRQIFAFLILSNLSLWVLEVSHMADSLLNTSGIVSFPILLAIIVGLNRIYSTLVFLQFWKNKRN